MDPEYPFHPIAQDFPLMEEDDLKALAADIEANGQKFPCLADKSGRIWDGRNRWLACQILLIAPWIETSKTIVTLTEVVTNNLKRLHLKPSARAQLVAKLARRLEQDSRMRSSANLKNSSTVSNDTIEELGQKGRSREHLAELASVSPPTMARAITIEKGGTAELKHAVADGKVSVVKAAKIARLPAIKQAAALAGEDAVEKDALGNVLPESIGRIFADSDKLKAIMNEISRLKSRLHELGDLPIGVYLAPQLQHIDAYCGNLHSAVKFSIPYALCPYCSGDSCRSCRSVGWMNEQLFEASPR